MPFVVLLLVGLTQLLEALARAGPDPRTIFHGFLPPHSSGTDDPFGLVESILNGIAANRGTVSLVAVPTFIWFATRLFAGVRTALNHVFDVTIRPRRHRNFLVAFVKSKARDVLMVIITLSLFLLNAALTAGLSYVAAREYRLEAVEFLFGSVGRLLGESLTVLFSVSLFFVVYKYASARRLPWRTALLAATFAAVMFELAKRGYAFYLANFAAARSASGDAKIAAVVLFVLWIHFTAIVFLLGGVVAETWEMRRMRSRQRALLE